MEGAVQAIQRCAAPAVPAALSSWELPPVQALCLWLGLRVWILHCAQPWGMREREHQQQPSLPLVSTLVGARTP